MCCNLSPNEREVCVCAMVQGCRFDLALTPPVHLTNGLPRLQSISWAQSCSWTSGMKNAWCPAAVSFQRSTKLFPSVCGNQKEKKSQVNNVRIRFHLPTTKTPERTSTRTHWFSPLLIFPPSGTSSIHPWLLLEFHHNKFLANCLLITSNSWE